MTANEIDIPTPDGTMDGYAACPDGPGKFPLVVVFMDIWGLREELFAIARRIAGHGYYCVAPNLFYREGKIRYNFRNAAGKTLSHSALPPDLQKQTAAHAQRLSRQTAHTDIAAILAFCRNQPVDDGAAGSVGFCMGGRLAFQAGQEFPERFRANASLHGTRLVSDAPDSVHRLTNVMRGEMYCGFGERDHFASPQTRAALDEAFARCSGVAYRSNLHAGADHGYALPDRDVYDEAAAEKDWAEIFAMYERQLARSG